MYRKRGTEKKQKRNHKEKRKENPWQDALENIARKREKESCGYKKRGMHNDLDK